MDENIWTLTAEEFLATQNRAEAINARATKRGFTGRIEVTGTEREITKTDDSGLKRTSTVFDVTITGEAPSYGGWTFLAAVDSIETATGTDFILRTAPGVDESGVDRSQLVAGRCQHCNSTRPNRRYTYLVRDENGQTRQVGSTCIKDFTGWAGRPVFLSTEKVSDDLSDFLSSSGSSRVDYAPETVIAAAWAISRQFGWAPASAYDATPTRDLVVSYLYGNSRADRELRDDVAELTTEANTMARTIITALLDGLEGDSDYVLNMRTLLQASHVSFRHMGLVVSAIAAYDRLIGETERRRLAAAERAQRRAETEHAGTVGEKITVTGKITRLKPIQKHYGYQVTTSMLVIIESATTVAKTFTSASWAWEVRHGDEVTVTATVKAHEEYQGARQTTLVRPKLDSRTPADSEPVAC